MALNVGYIQKSQTDDQGREVILRIYYDETKPAGPDQPLIDGDPRRGNGGRGWCLDVTNTSGRVFDLKVDLPDGSIQHVRVGQGDPVTSGPPAGRSRKAADLAQNFGIRTRGDADRINI